jgi:RNA polymerase sigma-70 factor (ECF subfamily)
MESVALVGQGNDYADLYRQYLPRIHNYVRLRVDSEALAQDLTAEAFERAVARQQTLRNPKAFGAWLFRIARNVVAGYYRGRKPTVALEAAAEQRAPGRSPVEEVQHREELARMRAALATLSEREQEIIRLKFGGGLGNQEIGKVMRLRAGNVAVILFRALRKLRSRMEEELVAELAESAEGS